MERVNCTSRQILVHKDQDMQKYDMDVLTSVGNQEGTGRCHLVCNNRDYGAVQNLLPINLISQHGGHCKLTHCPHSVPDTVLVTACKLNDEAKHYLSVLPHAKCPKKFYCT